MAPNSIILRCHFGNFVAKGLTSIICHYRHHHRHLFAQREQCKCRRCV